MKKRSVAGKKENGSSAALPTKIINGTKRTSTTPKGKPKPDGNLGIRRFLAPTNGIDGNSTNVKADSAEKVIGDRENGSAEKPKREPVGQTTKPPSARKALGERNVLSEEPGVKSRMTAESRRLPTSVASSVRPVSKMAHVSCDETSQLRPKPMSPRQPTPQSITDAVASPRSVKHKDGLKKADSGFLDGPTEMALSRKHAAEEATRAIEVPLLEQSPSDISELPSLTQGSIKLKCDQEETVFWLASPPGDKLQAAEKDGGLVDPEAEVTYLVKMLKSEPNPLTKTPNSKSRNGQVSMDSDRSKSNNRSWLELAPSPTVDMTPMSRQAFKRSFSLSNIESSPSARISERKRQRKEKSLHWTAADKTDGSPPVESRVALRDFIARCKSVFDDMGFDVPRSTSNNAASKSPGSGRRRPLERSISLPNIPSSGHDDLEPFLHQVSHSDKEPMQQKRGASSDQTTSTETVRSSVNIGQPELAVPSPNKEISTIVGKSATKSLQRKRKSLYGEDNKENVPPWEAASVVQPAERFSAERESGSRGRRHPVPVMPSNRKAGSDRDVHVEAVSVKSQDQNTLQHFEIHNSDRFTASSSTGQGKLEPEVDYFCAVDDDDDMACSLALDAVMQEYCSHNQQITVNLPIAGDQASGSERGASDISTPPAIETQGNQFRQKYMRFLVLEISWSEYGYAIGGCRSPEKILRLFDESTTTERYLHLREDWYSTDVNVGDYIHVLGVFDPAFNRCIADNEKSLVIVHPDTLVSATYVAESFDCLRKSILQARVRSFGVPTPPLVYGNLLHCLLQTCLAENDFSTRRINEEIDRLVRQSIEELCSIGETETVATAHLRESVSGLQQWASKFIGTAPKPDAVVQQHRNDKEPKVTVCISKVLDIEENIWSPMYGIKGNIDATVQLRVRQGSGPLKTLAAPFELKTGRNSKVVSHRAQTSLYTLMMSDRYDIDVASGILYYLKAGDMIQIPSLRDEVRGLIIARNAMASYLNSRGKLPPMIQRLHACQRCYALDNCLVYHKAIENGTADTSGLGSLFDKRTSHMTATHIAFFDKWERLITMEEGDMQRMRKEIWTLLGTEREKLRRCFSQMRLLPDIPESAKGSTLSGPMRRQYRFSRAASEPPSEPPASLLNSHIAVGDPIVVSTEDGHYALAIGFVVDLRPDIVTVSVDRRLRGAPHRLHNFDESKNQDFEGIMEVRQPGYRKENNCPGGEPSQREDRTMYRIDKDEFASGMGLVRANLVALFKAEGDAKRRRLIVDLEAPKFQHDTGGIALDQTLNMDQRHAVEKVMSALDYALILGMPGTGKTTTIAYIIQTLIKRGKTVLLTSYTHTAVDNVLLKLRDEGLDFLRLGNEQKIHSAIQPYTASYRSDINSVEDLEKFYMSKQIVATTCLGINHVLFTKRTFDYCIVDEASQLTLPVCLGPLRFADVFILVGDHYQLPPLVRNPEAKDTGLASSLFKILSEAHPEAVVNLEHQYRMNLDIMLLSNALIYNHRLRCGTPAVAHSALSVGKRKEGLDQLHATGSPSPHTHASRSCQGANCWIRDIVEPRRRVVFVNTDEVPAPDSRPGDLVQNDIEAILVHQIVECLIACGVEETALGVISPYRSQLKVIGQFLKHRTNVAIHTVDKFQGSDKDCVVVSLVRSNPKQNVGDLLRDWRRINVAFTRAKKKLIIFGSKSTLQGTALFNEFLQIIDSSGWEIKLPPAAHTMHSFPSPDEISASQKSRHMQSSVVRGSPEQRAVTAKNRIIAATKGKSGILRNVMNSCGLSRM
ncbi:hypothetical protein SpCBS45565_g06433 [Spizellomyces sp. 'palustris']|nr:hypothetical protein SpCBS45565_g06433 [Spizellomyces sp. 'palustris']